MRPQLLLFLGVIGCSTQSTSDDAQKIAARGGTVSVSRDAAVSNAVGSREHKQFVRAIIESANLESDLPDKVKGTPYAMEYFSMSRVAPEAFSIVSRYPESRDGWIALSKVCAYGDGEYALIIHSLRGRSTAGVSDDLFQSLSGLGIAVIQGHTR